MITPIPRLNTRLQRLRRRANDYLAAGDARSASTTLQSLLAEAPDDDDARLDFGLALLHLDHYREAHAQVLAACTRHLDDPALAFKRLEALRVFCEHERMQAIGRTVHSFESMPAHTLSLGADLLSVAGDSDLALIWAEAAVCANSNDLRTRVSRAMVAIDQGEFDAAQADLDIVCADSRLVPMAHHLLAIIRQQTESSNHVARLQSLLSLPHLSVSDKVPLAFALHKELDDLGRFDEAWQALDTGCRLKRQLIQYDADSEDRLLDAVRARFHRAATHSDATASVGATPIFIVGLHRSGTSLVERILEGHPAVAIGGESHRLTAQLCLATNHHVKGVIDSTLIARADDIDYRTLGASYLDAHAWLSKGHTHFTEKLPSNSWLVGFLQRALPSARIIHLVREPMDTCWSNLRELFSGNNAAASYSQPELARHCLRHHALMQHWHRTLPGFVLDVPYEALVRDPITWSQRLYQFCGLDWKPEVIQIDKRTGPVRTASVAQVRQPIHTRSLQRWRPYENHLITLLSALSATPAQPINAD